MWDGSEFLQPAGLIVVGRKMPMSQSLKPVEMLHDMATRMKVADGITVANQLTLT